MTAPFSRQDAPLWSVLTSRGKQFLELIYQVDQEVQEKERGQFCLLPGIGESTADSAYRWLSYGDIGTLQPSRLKQLLQRANLIDQQTQATFSQLESIGLIEFSTSPTDTGIRLTDLGHQTVLSGVEESVEPGDRSLPLLSEMAWRSLVSLQTAPDKVLSIASDSHYSDIYWQGWRALMSRRASLVKLCSGCVSITALGEVFYIEHYRAYRSLYPAVKAPAPTQTKADIVAALKLAGNLPELIRLKRGHQGLSQTAAAIGGGISPALLYQFEQGQPPTGYRLSAINSWLERAD